MKLADFRIAYELSQADLAALLTGAGAAVSVRAVQNWEQGVRATPAWVIAFLARLSKKEIREFPRKTAKTRPVGRSTKHKPGAKTRTRG